MMANNLKHGHKQLDEYVITQHWLWERSVGRQLYFNEVAELEQLEQLMLARKVLMSGRTLWLGGTNVAQTRDVAIQL